MRGADLLGLPARGPSGEDLGTVLDVRLVQDGPLLGAFAALRVEGFVVGHRKVATRLGYDRVDDQAPWLIGRAVRWWTRHNRYVRWEDCSLEDGELRANAVGPLPSIR